MKNHILKCGFYTIFVAIVISGSCTQRTDKNGPGVFADTIYLKNAPPQPGEDSWRFIDDLKAPMWTKLKRALMEFNDDDIWTPADLGWLIFDKGL